MLLAPPGSAAALPRCVLSAAGGALCVAGAPPNALPAGPFALELPDLFVIKNARVVWRCERDGLEDAAIAPPPGAPPPADAPPRCVAIDARRGAVRLAALRPAEQPPLLFWERANPRAVHVLACAAAQHAEVLAIGPVAAHVWFRPMNGAATAELAARVLRGVPFAGLPPPGAQPAVFLAVFNKAMRCEANRLKVAFTCVDGIDVFEAWEPLRDMLGGRSFFVHAGAREATLTEAPPGAPGAHRATFTDHNTLLLARADGADDAWAALDGRVWRFGRIHAARAAPGGDLRFIVRLDRPEERHALRLRAVDGELHTEARENVLSQAGTRVHVEVFGGAAPWRSGAEAAAERDALRAALRARAAVGAHGELTFDVEASRERVRVARPASARGAWGLDADGAAWADLRRRAEGAGGAALQARLAALGAWWSTAPAWAWRADGDAVVLEPMRDRACAELRVTTDDLIATDPRHAPAVARHALPLMTLERGAEVMMKGVLVRGVYADSEAATREGAAHHALLPRTVAMRVPAVARGGATDAAAFLGVEGAAAALRLAALGHSADEAADLAQMGVKAADGAALALPLAADAGLAPAELARRARDAAAGALRALERQAAHLQFDADA